MSNSIDKTKDSDNLKQMDQANWLAGKILTTSPDSPGVSRFQSHINAATKIKLGESLSAPLKSFCSLSSEDLACVISETEFPLADLWIEWEADNKFLCMWNRKNEPVAPTGSMGMLIKATPDKKSGVIQYISGEENIFLMPLVLLFDWSQQHRPSKENMEKLRQLLLKDGAIQQLSGRLKDKKMDDLLEIRSRFSYEESPYIAFDDEKRKKIAPVFQSAFEFINDSETFVIGVANLLACCNITDWRSAELVVN